LRAIAVTVLMSSFIACAGSAQAQAQSAVTGDVRCMLTMAALSGNKANQPQAGLGLFYFAGRIKAQNPAFNFATDLKPTAVKMTHGRGLESSSSSSSATSLSFEAGACVAAHGKKANGRIHVKS